jgi:hypothetical protein
MDGCLIAVAIIQIQFKAMALPPLKEVSLMMARLEVHEPKCLFIAGFRK